MVATAAVVLVDIRYFDHWSAGGLLALTGGTALVVYGLGARGGRPVEPTAERSALLMLAAAVRSRAE